MDDIIQVGVKVEASDKIYFIKRGDKYLVFKFDQGVGNIGVYSSREGIDFDRTFHVIVGPKRYHFDRSCRYLEEIDEKMNAGEPFVASPQDTDVVTDLAYMCVSLFGNMGNRISLN